MSNKVTSIDYLDQEDEAKTFRQKYSQMTQEQRQEYNDWGKSLNGYTGGGNFDDDPALKLFTLKKYNQMKDQGELVKISRLEENKAMNIHQRENASKSQMLLEEEGFEVDDLRQRSAFLMEKTRKKKTAIQRRQKYNNSVSDYNFHGGTRTNRMTNISSQPSQLDSVDLNMDQELAAEILHLKPDDAMYPRKRENNDTVDMEKSYTTILPQIINNQKSRRKLTSGQLEDIHDLRS